MHVQILKDIITFNVSQLFFQFLETISVPGVLLTAKREKKVDRLVTFRTGNWTTDTQRNSCILGKKRVNEKYILYILFPYEYGFKKKKLQNLLYANY